MPADLDEHLLSGESPPTLSTASTQSFTFSKRGFIKAVTNPETQLVNKWLHWSIVVALYVASTAWIVIHTIYVCKYNDTNMQGDLHNNTTTTNMHEDKNDIHYKWFEKIAFCCPSLDGLLNFALVSRWSCSRRTFSELKVPNAETTETTVAKWFRTHAQTTDWTEIEKIGNSLQWYLGGMFFTIVVRFAILSYLGLSGFSPLVSGFVLPLGFLIESLPHMLIASLIFGQTSLMSIWIQQHQKDVLKGGESKLRASDFHTDFANAVRSWSKAWNFLLVPSISMEVYSVVVQTLWCIQQHNPSLTVTLSSLVVTQGFYVAVKLLPIAFFNLKVEEFPNAIVKEAVKRDSGGDTPATPATDTWKSKKEKTLDVAMMSSHLFNSDLPFIKVLGVAPSIRGIKAVVISNICAVIIRLIKNYVNKVEKWSEDGINWFHFD